MDKVYSGVTLVDSTMVLSAGDLASATTINSGGVQQVFASAAAVTTFINSGGYQQVFSGGLAEYTSISSAGTSYGVQIIYNGGSALVTAMTGGVQVLASGGYASGTVISGNGQQTVYAGATVSGTVLAAGAVQALYMDPAVSGTTVAATGTVIYSNGAQIFMAGNTSDYIDMVALGTVVYSGGVQYLGYYSYNTGWVYQGGVSVSAALVGGVQYIPQRGTAIATTVVSGGTQNVLYGGLASGTQVYSGAQMVYNGAVAYGAYVQPISSGAQAYQVVLSGGVATTTVFNSGAIQNVSGGGASVLTYLMNDGYQYVTSGGFASGSILMSGGKAEFASGAYLQDANVASGALLYMDSGSVLLGAVVLGGGNLVIADGTVYVSEATLLADLTSATGLGIAHGSAGIYNSPGIRWGNYFEYAGLGVSLASGQATGIYAVSDLLVNGYTPVFSIVVAGQAVGSVAYGSAAEYNGYVYCPFALSRVFQSNLLSYGAQKSVYANGSEVQMLIVKETNYTGLVIDAASEMYTDIYAGCTVSGAEINANGKMLYIDNGAISRATRVRYGSECVNGGAASGTVVSSGGTLAMMNGGTSYDADIYGTLLYSAYNAEAASVVSGAAFHDGARLVADFSKAVGGKFVLLENCTGAPDSITLRLASGDVELAVGGSFVSGSVTYTCTLSGGTLSVDAFGKYLSLSGSLDEGGNSVLYASNLRIGSILTGTSQNTTGSVYANISLVGYNPGNIYGGGVNLTVEKNIEMAVFGDGEYVGMIYGGSYTGDGGAATVGGNINLVVDGIYHHDNVKLLKQGASAWVVGGGVAWSGASVVAAGMVSVTLGGGARLGQVVGGAQASGEGSLATVEYTNVALKDVSVTGDVFGGGYAYDAGTSIVSHEVYLTFDLSEGTISVQGSVYGGGANPSHPSKGGSSTVNGGTNVTFTGNGDNLLSIGTVSGDGKVVGTVAGTRVISFDNFSGTFFGNLINFDVALFAGNTSMSMSHGFSAAMVAVDVSTRDTPSEFMADLSGFEFSDEGRLRLLVDSADFTADNSFALFTGDLSAFDGAAVELWSGSGLIGSFAVGDTLAWGGGEFSISVDDGMRLDFKLTSQG